MYMYINMTVKSSCHFMYFPFIVNTLDVTYINNAYCMRIKFLVHFISLLHVCNSVTFIWVGVYTCKLI